MSLVGVKQSVLVHSVGELAVLLVISVLAVYKPAGITPFASGGELRFKGPPPLPTATWCAS
jgi:hypothetical protein